MNEKKFRLVVEEEFSNNLDHYNFPNRAIQVLQEIPAAEYPNYRRRDLILARHRGAFIKPCPATLNYNCCGLQIFHFGLGCTIGCRYCILEAYLGTEAMVYFANADEGIKELDDILQKPLAVRPKRFCTGEFTDSLLLDKNIRLAERLIGLFARRQDATLELKTKTDYIDHLLKLDHRGRTIISFSVNAPQICKNEESGAAPLLSRLKAAKRASEAGYPIGLHFDPIIYFKGWEQAYGETVDMIGRYLGQATVAWVSMGCFRYLPSLKNVMLEREPDTHIYDGEFIRGGDGKMRYPRPLRTYIYKVMVSSLQKALKADTLLYMCMESPRVWQDVFSHDPQTDGLTQFLDQRALFLASQLSVKDD